MGNKQLLAQIAVFALLGLNVGAYYVFWPHKDSDAQPPAQEKGQTRIMPAKKEPPPPVEVVAPKEIPGTIVSGATPLQIANPPVVPPQENANDDESIKKLLERINKDDVPVHPLVLPHSLPLESTPNDKEPKILPPFNADPLLGDVKPSADKGVAVTSALTPRVAPSPWLLSMEMVGEQTQLIARVRRPVVDQRQPVEFRILCDRVEVKSPGTVQALGKVTVTGVGMKGTCQRLTLPLHDVQLIFEIQAKITQDANTGTMLSGERIVWEFNASAETQPLTQPDFRPFNSFPLTPPTLGQPK